MSECELDDCKFDGAECKYCGHKAPELNRTYCLKHYRQTFPDKGCDLCELEGRLHSVQEIYAGMEGFKPETAPEGYCLRIIEQMYKAAAGLEGEV